MLSKSLQTYLKQLLTLRVRHFITSSEQVEKGDVFVCREGISHDSHHYISEAVKKGAIAIMATKAIDESLLPIPVLTTSSYYQSLSLIKAYYRFPHHKLNHIGVTGTNGKTTVALGLKQIINQRVSCGYIGTLGAEYAGEKLELNNTTPDGVTLLNLFHDMVERDVQTCVMEMSSHALAQDRAGFVPLDVGVLTNIGSDHLDYHRTIDGYVQAKIQIVDRIRPGGSAVINLDDAHAAVALERARGRVQTLTFSCKSTEADLYASDVHLLRQTSHFTLHFQNQAQRIHTRLPFQFNIENLLAMAGVLFAFNWDFDEVAAALEMVAPIKGRSESLNLESGALAIVDYAHNYDGLLALYRSIDRQSFKRVITVVGVTGERTQEAAKIGQLCAQNSDIVLFTSDNPLGVCQQTIFSALTSEIKDAAYYQIEDRIEAIRFVNQISQPDDLILVCGKGHERYQRFTKERSGQRDYIGDFEALKLGAAS